MLFYRRVVMKVWFKDDSDFQQGDVQVPAISENAEN